MCVLQYRFSEEISPADLLAQKFLWCFKVVFSFCYKEWGLFCASANDGLVREKKNLEGKTKWVHNDLVDSGEKHKAGGLTTSTHSVLQGDNTFMGWTPSSSTQTQIRNKTYTANTVSNTLTSLKHRNNKSLVALTLIQRQGEHLSLLIGC